MSTTDCRLCANEAAYMFELPVRGRHRVKYYRCRSCGSLQTEEPYWLDEAYGKNAEIFDACKASRVLDCFFSFPGFMQALEIGTGDICVDFGGGSGLFARLMRDVGYGFHSYDKYSAGEFIQSHLWEQPDQKSKLVTMFEVIEHFSRPAEEWAGVFAMDPDWVIVRTLTYQGQGADWDYLIPQSGQHVFIHSAPAISLTAEKYGRFTYSVGEYFLISRDPLTETQTARLNSWQRNLKTTQNNTFEFWRSNLYHFSVKDYNHVISNFRACQALSPAAPDNASE